MDVKLDTLVASRKLEKSGMPRPQAEAAVEVVNDAMRNLVTEKHFNAELDRRFAKVDLRFTRLESKIDQRFTRLETKTETAFANLGRSQAWGFVYMSGFPGTRMVPGHALSARNGGNLAYSSQRRELPSA